MAKKASAKKSRVSHPPKKSRRSRRQPTKKGKLKLILDAICDAKGPPSDAAYDYARHSLNLIINPEDKSLLLTREDFALFLASVTLSTMEVPGYATVDKEHVHDIRKLVEQIREFVQESSNRRPLNFLMLAAPGAGKSHFIDCVAKMLEQDGVEAIKFDMTSLQRNEDLELALDAARNSKVEDNIPLLFLDEFDSRQEHISLLLPLLWEGVLTLGQKTLKLGRAAIVLAGSNPALPTIMNHARGMGEAVAVPDGTNPKIVDLLSRINGSVVQIPAFSEVNSDGLDRQLDKVCVAVSLLRHRFGDELRSVPLALLRYIVHTEFRYGVRSIAHLVQLLGCERKKVVHLTLDLLKTPMDTVERLKGSSLIYHLLNKDQVRGVHSITDAWEEERKTKQQMPVNVLLALRGWWRYLDRSDKVVEFTKSVQDELKSNPPPIDRFR